MNKARIVLAAVVVMVLGLGWTVAVHAQGLQNFRSGSDVTVAKAETVDRTLFAFGSTIDIAGTVNGDVFCAGQSVTISGTINGDVICAGQVVSISGTVSGNVRLLGQTTVVSGQVAHNLTAGGQSFTLDSAAKVGEDASIAAQNATLNGTIGRDLTIGSTAVTVDGAVGRDIQSAATSLVLGNSAAVGGNVHYISAQTLSRDSGAQIAGTITHEQPPVHHNNVELGSVIRGSFTFALYMFVALILISLVTALCLPQAVHHATDVAISSPMKTVAVGLIASIVAPIVFVILMATIVGIPLALLGLLVWVVLVCLAWSFAAYYLGRLLLAKRANNAIWTMLLGAAIILILSFVPIIGFIVCLLALWFGLGIILLQFRRLPIPRYTTL